MPSTILKSLVAAAALASALPAFAMPVQTSTRTVLKYDARTQKYCVTDPAPTGSHIMQITCKTADEWTAAGLRMPTRTASAAAPSAATPATAFAAK